MANQVKRFNFLTREALDEKIQQQIPLNTTRSLVSPAVAVVDDVNYHLTLIPTPVMRISQNLHFQIILQLDLR